MTTAARKVLSFPLLLGALLLLCITLSSSSSFVTANPTQAYPSILMLEISAIDGVARTFYADFYFSLYYQDPGLLHVTDAENGDTPTAAHLANFTRHITIDFVNKDDISADFDDVMVHQSAPAALTTGDPSTAVLHQYGENHPWVEISARYKGTFSTTMNLKDFPFDKHTLSIEIETTILTSSQVAFNTTLASRVPFLTDSVKILSWETTGTSISTTDHFYTNWQQNYSRVVYEVSIERKPGYFIRKIGFGIVLSTLMCHFLGYMVPSDAARPFGQMCAFLGLIAYLFVITEDVPKVSYNTKMDRFVNFSLYSAFAAFAISMLVFWIQRMADRTEARSGHKSIFEDEEDEDKNSTSSGSGGSGGSGSSPFIKEDDEEKVEQELTSKTAEQTETKEEGEEEKKKDEDDDADSKTWIELWTDWGYAANCVLVSVVTIAYAIGTAVILG